MTLEDVEKYLETVFSPPLNEPMLTFLVSEVKRLKRGEFTPEEFQTLCHNLHENPSCTLKVFGEGCHEFQRKLFGNTYDPSVTPKLEWNCGPDSP